MKLFIGPTDYDWYCELRDQNFDEVNFWRPGMSPFRALQPNDLFLFKLKKPYYAYRWRRFLCQLFHGAPGFGVASVWQKERNTNSSRICWPDYEVSGKESH